jgi:ABC-2 type transport system permease protein
VKSALVVLLRIRLAEILARPSGAFWFFVLPIILLLLVAGLFANGHPFERRHVAVVGELAPVARVLAAEVRAGGLSLDPVVDETRARARLDTRTVSAVVIVDPDRGTRVVVGGRDATFGRGLVAALDEGGVTPSLGRTHPRLETAAPVANGYVLYLVPGILAQGVIIAGLFGMGYAMVRYRQSRFLRKLATTPLSRSDFVLAQILARVVLVSLQLLLLLVVARLCFGLPLTAASIAWVVLLGAVGLVTFMGIGFALSCVVQTEGMVVDIINALTVPIVLLSEIFFSAEELPRALAWISSTMPSTAMVRAMRAVLLHGDEAMAAVVPALGVLGAWALASYLVAVHAFKWR